jgi:hypothetical protein
MMKESDQLVTSFVTSFRTYCYVTMPFGLKNERAMYQHCMLTILGDLIWWTIEAYVDDIVVKSKQTDNLVANLDQAFKCLRAKNIKLNLEKCVFGVLRGMLLGFIVSKRGIEANPKKISAITKWARSRI